MTMRTKPPYAITVPVVDWAISYSYLFSAPMVRGVVVSVYQLHMTCHGIPTYSALINSLLPEDYYTMFS